MRETGEIGADWTPALESPRLIHLEEVSLAVTVRERGVYVRRELLPGAADAHGVATGDAVVRQLPVVFTWKFDSLSILGPLDHSISPNAVEKLRLTRVPLNTNVSPSFELNIASTFGSLHNSGSSSAGGAGRDVVARPPPPPPPWLVFFPYKAWNFNVFFV